MKDLSNEKVEAQLTKYFHKVICNAAYNYYKKKFHQTEKEHLIGNFFDYSMKAATFEEALTVSEVEMSLISTFNGTFNDVLKLLNSREKQFLIEKFVLEKTDEQIGVLFGVSRQAITNRKHRLYKKIRRIMTASNLTMRSD
ncbi:hypothetical protein A7N94_01610 [Listeria monocytogenes]|uniref:sigma-70 family RNA polymerase sigma factor n=1 Tax=Listeria monocytogenes TaxID=1639 RepID=UPI000BDF15D9|nr:sigma-70 family RNA polymerase sigma factor [Listeria monocytogenes]PCW48133.1 hypothetical protein A7N94_01610 [Listeria monocytogenes]RJA01330.1 sigma-70 family RNA polymerase sigma factor [Listeria monocytogenes]